MSYTPMGSSEKPHCGVISSMAGGRIAAWQPWGRKAPEPHLAVNPFRWSAGVGLSWEQGWPAHAGPAQSLRMDVGGSCGYGFPNLMVTTDSCSDSGSRFGWWSGIIMCLFALALFGVGGWMAWDQASMVESACPVQATVLARSIEAVPHRGTSPDSYRPQVRYRYVVDRISYESDQVTPLQYSSSESWASAMLGRVPTNSIVTAYYHPTDPSAAYLLREISFLPYIFVLVAMIFLWAGLAPIIYGESKDELRSVRMTTFSSVVWLAGGAMVVGHYFTAGGEWSRPVWISLTVHLFIGGSVLFRGLSDWKLLGGWR